jgi:hypothetical protein
VVVQPKVDTPKPVGWFKGLLAWLESTEGQLFLMISTVLHACWGKPFVKRILAKKLSVAAVQPIVVEFSTHLGEWASDPSKAFVYEGRGMSFVRTHTLAGTHAHARIRARLRTVFVQMENSWKATTVEYQPGGKFDVKSNPALRAVLENTPCTSTFEESYFGTMTDTGHHMGPMAHPLKVVSTAIARQNNGVLTPMLEEDVAPICRMAQDLIRDAGSCIAKRQQVNKRAREEKEEKERQKKNKKPKPTTKSVRQPRSQKSQPKKRRNISEDELAGLVSLGLSVSQTTRTGRSTALPARYATF